MKRTPILLIAIGVVSLLTSIFSGVGRQKNVQQIQVTKEATATTQLVSSEGEFVLVTRVVDGDTIEIAGGKKVRYIGVDTPELRDPRKPIECFGREADDENKRLVLGKTVRLEKDVSETDQFGRLLRYVYTEGGMMVNAELVKNGFARVATYPPDVKYAKIFTEGEVEARGAGRGLWTGCRLN